MSIFKKRYNPYSKVVKKDYKKKYKKMKTLFTGSIKRSKYYIKGPSKELKFTDSGTSSYAAVAVGMINGLTINLTNCALGNNAYERIGMKITIRSIQVRLKAYQSVLTNTNIDTTYRIIIWRYKGQCPKDYTSADEAKKLLLNTVSGVYSEVQAVSALSLYNSQSFTVLKDVTTVLSDSYQRELFWQYYHKCNYPAVFSADTGAVSVTNIKDGAIFITILPTVQLGVTVSSDPQVALFARIRYWDD